MEPVKIYKKLRKLRDAVDEEIIQCIFKNPGTNIVSVWRCLAKRLEPPRLYVVHYRIKTLEAGLYVKTKRVQNERRCWISEGGCERQSLKV